MLGIKVSTDLRELIKVEVAPRGASVASNFEEVWTSNPERQHVCH